MRHTIAVWVENEFGVLTRVANLFSARGFNIESLCVAPTEDPTLSRITLVTRGNDRVIEQIVKQLRRLIPVYRIDDLTNSPHVERELLLAKIRVDAKSIAKAKAILKQHRARLVDATSDSLMLELTGDIAATERLLVALRTFGVTELARSGALAMAKIQRQATGVKVMGGKRLATKTGSNHKKHKAKLGNKTAKAAKQSATKKSR